MTRAPASKRSASAARPARAQRPARFSLHGVAEISPGEERWLTRAAWAVIALVGAALVWMAAGPHRIGDYMTETDFYGAYAQGARLIEQGRLIPSRYGVVGPGYEVLLGLVGFVVHDLFVAAESISIVATLAALFLWFALLKRRAGARVALFATLFMATNAYFYRYGFSATTDALAIALQAAVLYALLARVGPRAMLVAGLFAALAFLTRYNAIYLLPAGLVAILAGGTLVEQRLRSAALFTAGFLALVVPWVLYSATHGGAHSIELYHNIAYEVFARSKGIVWDTYQKELQPQFHSLWDVIVRDPKAVASRMVLNVGDHLRLDGQRLLGWPVAIAALAGIVFGFRDGTLRRLWPLWLAGALLFATLVPVFSSERYSLALLPFYAALAAIAFASPTAALVFARRLWLKPALAVIPLAFAVSASARIERVMIDQLPIEVLECAKTLRQLRQPGDRVIARKGHISYHGDVEPLGFPFVKTLPELAAYARESKAQWLYFSWPEAETRPELGYLLDSSAVVPGLTVRCVTRPHPAVLYEIGPEFGAAPQWAANDTLVAWHQARSQLLLDAGNPRLLYRVGGLAWMMGRGPEARAALERAARVEPGNLETLVLLGNVLVGVGEIAEAKVVYRHASSFAPDDPRVRLGLGWVSWLSQDAEATASAWRPIISTTSSPQVLEIMVRLYHELGDAAAEAEARAGLARATQGP